MSRNGTSRSTCWHYLSWEFIEDRILCMCFQWLDLFVMTFYSLSFSFWCCCCLDNWLYVSFLDLTPKNIYNVTNPLTTEEILEHIREPILDRTLKNVWNVKNPLPTLKSLNASEVYTGERHYKCDKSFTCCSYLRAHQKSHIGGTSQIPILCHILLPPSQC